MKVAPTQLIPDAPEQVLDYLVQRSADTVAAEMGRADAIVLGVVEATGGHGVSVLAKDVITLRPWLSGEAGEAPKIMVFHTRIRVESWLTTPGARAHVDVQVVPRRDSLGAEIHPLFRVNERGLVFLRRMPAEAPWAAYVAPDAYQLAHGETGVRSGTAHAQAEWLDAVRWHLALPAQADARAAALLEALAVGNPVIVRQAVRELADRHVEGAAARFSGLLASAADPLRSWLMLGLWILGERAEALAELERAWSTGRAEWLAGWGLQSSSGEAGMLFGPATPDTGAVR